ncbi:MAG: polysaccharide deacetylase family protein [Verrucomicrobia bacterium]|nr:polysaccharide deacetylase family protein [Verrucomicrobiota bacterium]MBI3869497.1 polysaccharide deacetylase family protein [Verrucomicrobiota bacterium]
MNSLPAWLIVLLLATLFNNPSARAAEERSLAEELGFRKESRILIINGDDVGGCHSANVATIEALENGLMTSATIMVPCPWFNEIAHYAVSHPDKDFGVHLCQTCEWKSYRWGPVASREKIPGLIDPEGYLWASVEEVYAKSNPQEAYWEAKAQIEKALAAQVDVTHLDSHMGTMQVDPRYLEMYVRLGLEYRLPLRMASESSFVAGGFPKLRQQIAARGIVFPDFFIHEELKDEKNGVKEFWIRLIRSLKPGVTELYIHAAKVSDELKAITGSWKTRNEQYELFTHDAEFRKLLEDEKILRMGYRPLRELQRARASR